MYVCVEHAVFVEINNYYLCISISENTTEWTHIVSQ